MCVQLSLDIRFKTPLQLLFGFRDFSDDTSEHCTDLAVPISTRLLWVYKGFIRFLYQSPGINLEREVAINHFCLKDHFQKVLLDERSRKIEWANLTYVGHHIQAYHGFCDDRVQQTSMVFLERTTDLIQLLEKSENAIKVGLEMSSNFICIDFCSRDSFLCRSYQDKVIGVFLANLEAELICYIRQVI